MKVWSFYRLCMLLEAFLYNLQGRCLLDMTTSDIINHHKSNLCYFPPLHVWPLFAELGLATVSHNGCNLEYNFLSQNSFAPAVTHGWNGPGGKEWKHLGLSCSVRIRISERACLVVRSWISEIFSWVRDGSLLRNIDSYVMMCLSIIVPLKVSSTDLIL